MAVLSMTLVQAQERTYSGVVKGSDGQPIIGASVEVVGTTVGTSTGLDGDYTIKAKQGSKIKYSFLGTKSVTATAGSQLHHQRHPRGRCDGHWTKSLYRLSVPPRKKT